MFDSKEKKYFKRKLLGVQKMIWDNEFKREKTLSIREEVRREYDAIGAKLHIVLERIKDQLKTPDKICEVHNPEKGKEKVHKDKGNCICEYNENHLPIEEIEQLYDKKEILLRDKERYEGQMAGLDVEVNGSKPTNQYPEGYEGINQILDSLRELQIMLREYIKKL